MRLISGRGHFQSAREAVEDAVFSAVSKVVQLAARVESKSVELLPGCEFFYYDNNNLSATETLVLLHGFNSSKDHWLYAAAHLKQYRLIIPDLGGHGQTWYDEKISYNVPYQAQLLHQLLSVLNIQSYHLVGNSMGGWIAAHYTLEYPTEVKTLSLLNAAGVISPVKSPFFKALETGKNYFFYSDRAEFEEYLKIGVKSPPFTPWPILHVQARRGIARNVSAKKIFAAVMNQNQTYFAAEQLLDARLASIKQPVLIIWGKQDYITDISMADVFASGLPHSEKIILDNTGHVPMLEHPKRTATLISNFVEKNPTR